MNKEELEYPKHWEVVLLGDFVHSEKGKKPKNLCDRPDSECNIPYIDIKAFEKGIVDKYTDGENCRFCYENDILIVWDGSRSGLVGKGKNGALGSTLARLNFFGINNDYAYYFMKSKYLEINSRAKGAATPHVDPELLWNYRFPLPPIEEQNRIVAKIESLFSELDKSIESLQTAKKKLALYRQSVLKAAFEGELTKAWREAHKDELEDADTLFERIKKEREEAYEKRLEEWKVAVKAWEENGKEGKKPAKPKKPKELPPLSEEELREFPKIPPHWNIVRLGLLIEEPKYGTSKKSDYKTKGIGVLRIPNIADGYIDATDLKYAKFDEYEKTIYSLKKGDLLTIRSNGSISLVGKTALVSQEDQKYLYAGYLIRLRPYNRVVDSKFLLYLFESMIVRNQIESKARSTSGVNNINSQEIVNMLVPVCSLAEQTQIVNDVEKRVNELVRLDESINEILQRAKQLRQGILKEAFKGKLIASNLNDEPVSELLIRIQKEKQLFLEQEKIKRENNNKKKTLPKKKRYLMDILKILEQQPGWIKAQQVFEKYTNDKSSDTIEKFYKELRDLLNGNEIEVKREKDGDYLRISKLSKESS